MKNQTPTINIFEKAVRKVSKSLVRDFGETENLQIQSKNIGDFVTKADLKAEKELLDILQYYYPNYSYITEETETIKGKGEETIVIDPIDGTTNFIHGIPIFSIVLSKIIKDEIIDGVIFNPITNDFFWASKGTGAWCNNKRLRVSKRENFKVFFVSIDPERDTPEIIKDYLGSFENKIYGITGDPKKIFVLSKSWGVLSEKIFTEDGNYLINHSSSVLLLENGKYLDRINHHATYKDMFKAINKYLR